MAAKTLKGLKNINPDNIGHLRSARMSEMSTEVRAQNLAHTNTLRKQLNEWYKEQHLAVHKLSHGQQKLFRNLIKVENEKRRIERQNHIKKQEQLRQKLRERARKQKEEALKRAMEMNMLSLALENDNEKAGSNKTSSSTSVRLPKIKKVSELKLKDNSTKATSSKKKRHERSMSLEPLDTKRHTYSREKVQREDTLSSLKSLDKMNRTSILPAIQTDLKISAATVTSLKSDFEIIAAVSEANELSRSPIQPEPGNLEDSKPPSEKLQDTSRGTLSTPHFKKYSRSHPEGDTVLESEKQQKADVEGDKTWNPKQSQTRVTDGAKNSKSGGVNHKNSSEKQKLQLRSPPISNLSALQPNTKNKVEALKTSLNISLDIKEKLPSNKRTIINLNSNNILPAINTSETPIDGSEMVSNTPQLETKRNRQSSIATSTSSSSNTVKNGKKRRKLKERQSLIDDMHRYHISIADSRRYTIPNFVIPAVDSVVKYSKNSQGSFVSSDVTVKPAAEDFKLPSKKSEYLLEKALKWEQGRVQPRLEKLDHFYNQVSEHIEKSKRPSFIPKPKVPKQAKDILPSIPLGPTIQSRTFGTSLEGHDLRQDVQDLRNCRYLRFKDTDLKNTLNDAVEDEPVTAQTHSKRKMSSWGHLELPIRRPKLNSIY